MQLFDRTALVAVSFVLLVGPLTGVSRTIAPSTTTDPDACSLLTDDQVNAAIEAKTQPGQHLVASSTKECIWSDAAPNDIAHRRVTLSMSSPASLELAKGMKNRTVESVSGLGDEAFYLLFRSHEAPYLYVKKGNSVFWVRLLNGLKAKELSLDEVKARDLALAKAAVAKF